MERLPRTPRLARERSGEFAAKDQGSRAIQQFNASRTNRSMNVVLEQNLSLALDRLQPHECSSPAQ
jgi:hypothetical protein